MVAMERYLEDRIAIITGGFSGIGKAIALALAERGATIALGARRQPAAVVEELESVSDRCFFHQLDVASVDSINEFVGALAVKHGHADILVNAAGVTAHELVCGHDERSWLDVIDINLFRSVPYDSRLPAANEDSPLGSYHKYRFHCSDDCNF
jgi:NAD(P)-dependent dehydrogenase (short-subunit alcohol dehydrogenase family)